MILFFFVVGESLEICQLVRVNIEISEVHDLVNFCYIVDILTS